MKTNRHRAEVIEVYDNGEKAAVRFTSGRIECVTRLGTNPSPFYVGEKGIVTFVMTPTMGIWVFERRVRKSTSQYMACRRLTKLKLDEK